MEAECTRMTCNDPATILLAYDPRTARAWLRDFSSDVDPSLGLILCTRHGEATSVPVAWELIDERIPVDLTVPAPADGRSELSFDDIFPPRSAGRPDPWADDEPTWDDQKLTEAEAEEVIAKDPAVAPLLIDDDDYLDYDEAEELLAPELPASGTDGMGLTQPQLPMIAGGSPIRPADRGRNDSASAPAAPSVTPRPMPSDPAPPSGSEPQASTSADGMNFLFVEEPAESSGDAISHLAAAASAADTGDGSPPGETQNGRALPLFGQAAAVTVQMQVPSSSTLLSRAFRTIQTDS